MSHFNTNAKKQIRKLPKSVQIIIGNKIRKLLLSGVKLEKLSGRKNFYKVRIGDYRIVIVKLSSEIEVVLVAHKKEVYKILPRLFK